MSLAVLRFSQETAWIAAILEDFRIHLRQSLARHQKSFHANLSGGTTPGPFYKALALDPECARLSSELDIHLWVGDEREVPAQSSQRNGKMIENILGLGSRWVKKPPIHLWPEGDRDAACQIYDRELTELLGPDPVFDLSILGMGADGHSAGLFSALDIVEDAGKALTIATLAPSEPVLRMSLTARVFKASRSTMILLKGGEKEAILQSLLETTAWFPVREVMGKDSRLYYLCG